MALNWKWKDKIGYIKVENSDSGKFSINLYDGNALMIAITEWKEEEKDMYSLYSFFCDEEHAKKCLGLMKNGDGEYNYIMIGIKEIHLKADMKDKKISKLVKLWSEAIMKYDLDVKLILEKGDWK